MNGPRPARPLARLLALAIVVATPCARAQDAAPSDPEPKTETTDASPAERLFSEGRELLARGDIEGACTRFDASRKLQPAATGPLVNFAVCNEQLGRFATSAALYREVVARTRDSQPERAAYATERLREVESKVSTLTIALDDRSRDTPVRVTLDGRELQANEWSAPIALDGGEHRVTVDGEGFEPFRQTVQLGRERDRIRVDVVLAARKSDLRTAGWVIAGTGAAVAIVGVGLGISVAVECGGLFQDICEGPNRKATLAERERALSAEETKGWISNVAVGVGVIALAAGTYLVLRSPTRGSTQARMGLMPNAQGGALSFDARF